MFPRDMRVLCQEAEKSASLQLIGLQVTVLSILLFDTRRFFRFLHIQVFCQSLLSIYHYFAKLNPTPSKITSQEIEHCQKQSSRGVLQKNCS